MPEPVWIEAHWDSVRVGDICRIEYPDGATLFGKIESLPRRDLFPGAAVAQIFLGEQLGVLPVEVSNARVYRTAQGGVPRV